MSVSSFGSPPWTRFGASDSNATVDPSLEIDGARLWLLPTAPLGATEASNVAFDERSRTETWLSGWPAAFERSETNAMREPSAETDGDVAAQACSLSGSSPTSVVTPVERRHSRTRLTSHVPTAVRPAGGRNVNATAEPSAEIAGSSAVPPAGTKTPSSSGRRIVVPSLRSRTKTSWALFVSLPTRLFASEAKATQRPFSEIDGAVEGPFANPPFGVGETSDVEPGTASRLGSPSGGWARGMAGAAGCPRGTEPAGGAPAAGATTASASSNATANPAGRRRRCRARATVAGSRNTGPRDRMCHRPCRSATGPAHGRPG